jgi:phage FluMu protein gp41
MSALDADLARRMEHLGAYARDSLVRAERFAARLHAEELTPEHWLAALLADEDCAATRLVLHAFADPEALGIELVALCPGIMVVGSGRTLPFSVRSLAALRAARTQAAGRAALVRPPDLFRSARSELTAQAAERLAASGELPEPEAEEAGRPTPPTPEHFFRCFSPEALRALGAACRVAGELRREAIGPVHLLAGALEADPELRERTRLSAARLRLSLAGLDEDPTPLPERTVPADARLFELLSGLAPGSSTLDVLGWILSHGSEELRALLRRQKITPALHERARKAFRDPG